MTSQPKDKEQLKKEAREVFRKAGLDVEADETSAQVFSELLIIINKTHRSGRDSMREECMKWAEQSFPTFGKDLATSLKKIKL